MAVVALVASLLGCGSETPDRRSVEADPGAGSSVSGAPADEGSWTHEVLPARPGPDSKWVLGVDGQDLLVAFTTDAGDVHGFAATGTGDFTGGATLATGLEYLDLAGAARLDGRWIAVGTGGLDGEQPDDQLAFRLGAYSSTDGRTWEELDSSGLDGPADIQAVAATSGRVVAVGNLRAAEDPSMGGFEAAIWSSTDGTDWTRSELPRLGTGDSVVQDVVVVGSDLLATADLEGTSHLWRSVDGGVTWVEIEPAGTAPGTRIVHLAVQGEVVVAGASLLGDPEDRGTVDPEEAVEGSERQTMLWSTDGGATWEEASTVPSSSPDEPYPPEVHGAGGRFFTPRRSSVPASSEPEICYADIGQCTAGPVDELWSSDDGRTWALVDTSGIKRPQYAEVDTVLGATGGRLVFLVGTEAGVEAWSWPAEVSLPPGVGAAPPRRADVRTLDEGEEPEVGVRYAVPLYVHCGMDWLHLGEQPWQRADDGPELETGAGDSPPPGWPVAGQTIYGYATLGADGTVEYTTEAGEVMATYRPPTTELPGGCA